VYTKKINSPYAIVFNACLNALEKLAIAVNEKNELMGFIVASTNAELLSFGNDIRIEMSIQDGDYTILTVTSKSCVSLQIIDWGTNKKIEEAIVNEVMQHCAG
jgi:hypothetical protein